MKDKGLLIVMLCLVVIVMSVAYAAFASNLNINGTASIASTWKVEFDAANSSCSDGSAVTVSGTTATLNVGLKLPGDEVTCTITVKNAGTLDAKLTSIASIPTGNAPITFTVTPSTADLASRPILAKSGGTEVISVKITYDEGVSGQPENIEKSVVVTANYVQALGA